MFTLVLVAHVMAVLVVPQAADEVLVVGSIPSHKPLTIPPPLRHVRT